MSRYGQPWLRRSCERSLDLTTKVIVVTVSPSRGRTSCRVKELLEVVQKYSREVSHSELSTPVYIRRRGTATGELPISSVIVILQRNKPFSEHCG